MLSETKNVASLAKTAPLQENRAQKDMTKLLLVEDDRTLLDTLTFNFDTDPARVVPTGDFLNATDPDLSLFQANGGKLLMWNGWADPAATPVRAVRYFLDTVYTLGEDTPQFSRLFMAPGVQHCGGGSGPNNFDMLTPLENWVERGVAPDRIIAAHMTGNVVEPPCYGDGKVTWAQRYADEHNATLSTAYFYTDSHSDQPLLELVGHPIAVNPDARLKRVAHKRGWPIEMFY